MENTAAKQFQFLVVVAAYGLADKTYGVFPYIVATYKFVLSAAVNKCKRTLCELIGSIGLGRIVAK